MQVTQYCKASQTITMGQIHGSSSENKHREFWCGNLFQVATMEDQGGDGRRQWILGIGHEMAQDLAQWHTLVSMSNLLGFITRALVRTVAISTATNL